MRDSVLMPRGSTLAGFTAVAADAPGVQADALAPMSVLVVQTRNSCYRIVVASGDAVQVEGGRFFPRLTAARLGGASLGGSLLRVGWIGVGLRMELLVGGSRIVTSPVQAVRQVAAGAVVRVH